ncbi:MAG TPA: hypothetical protein PK677_15695 [Acidiphilium sp.]|nr:MAG: hypothetical protein B7X48_14330 [Acidiphilium sp. 34-60-192]HQT89958.1 hypothetical protein [Acidiphilium sp.]
MMTIIYATGLFGIPAMLYFGVAAWRAPTKPLLVIPALLWLLLCVFLSWRMSIAAYSPPLHPTEIALFSAEITHIVRLVFLLIPITGLAWMGAHLGAKRQFR